MNIALHTPQNFVAMAELRKNEETNAEHRLPTDDGQQFRSRSPGMSSLQRAYMLGGFTLVLLCASMFFGYIEAQAEDQTMRDALLFVFGMSGGAFLQHLSCMK